jgi:predicted ATPase/DNA-binding XRE family transcriptional regulator
MPDATFGELLREYRRAAGCSQETLAERAGLSVGAVSALEQGIRRAARRDTVDALASALDLSESLRRPFEESAALARKRQRPDDARLPIALTSFIERNEVQELEALLAEHRLLTITGSGGVGKTRIAIEVARRCERLYDETWFIDLLPVRDGSLIASQMAGRLNVPLRDDDGLGDVVRQLRARHALLVIDNCEHVVADAAGAVGSILQRCPSLVVLATSRETLALSGELSYRLPSMGARAAAELFVARAQASDRTWSADARRLALVADICKELDGIPLAIELAASRLSTLGIDVLRSRLGAGIGLTGHRDLPPRHQTMTATIAWSHDLLTEPERLLFRRSSVVMGSFTLAWAEAVCADESLPAGIVADTLSRLVQKCLINVEHVGTSTCYRFLESIRAFAQQRLAESGEVDEIMSRDLAWFEHEATFMLERPSIESTMEHRVELDNVRAAIQWAQASGKHAAIVSAAHILIGFSLVYSWSTRVSEGRMLGLGVLERLNEDEDPELVSRLIYSLITLITGTERMALAPRAIPLLVRTGQPDRAAFLHAKLAEVEANRGNVDAARAHVDAAEALLAANEFRRSRSGRVTAMTCAYVCSILRDFDRARALLAQAEPPVGDAQELEAQIVLAELEFQDGHVAEAGRISKQSVAKLGSYPAMPHLAIMVFGNHARYMFHLGAQDEAEEAIRVALHRAVDIRDSGFLYVTSSLARHAAAYTARAGRAELAVRLLGACDATDERNGRPSIKDAPAEELAATAIAAHLSRERAELLHARGTEEDLHEVLEEYLAQVADGSAA